MPLEWGVSEGYEWVPADLVLGTRGVPGLELAARYSGRLRRRYRPMDHPALFREFADLGNDPDRYLEFAREHGHLTVGVHVTGPCGQGLSFEQSAPLWWPAGEPKTTDARPAPNPTSDEETLDLWARSVADMRRCVEALERRRRDPDVRAGLHRAVGENLWCRLAPGFDDAGAFVTEPTDLLAALWLQFAHALAGNGEFRKCRQCSRWFVVSGKDGNADRATRSDKEYCDDPCRQRAAFLRRKKRAAGKQGGTGGRKVRGTAPRRGDGR